MIHLLLLALPAELPHKRMMKRDRVQFIIDMVVVLFLVAVVLSVLKTICKS